MFRLLLCFAAFILSEDSETGSGDAVEESKEDEKMIINLEEVAMSVPMVPHHWKSSRHMQILMQSVKLQRFYRILHKCRGKYVSTPPYNFSSLCLHVAKFEDAVYCVYIERQKHKLPVHVHCSCCGIYVYTLIQSSCSG